MRLATLLLLFAALAALPAWAQTPEATAEAAPAPAPTPAPTRRNLFYQDLDYGSASQFNPLTVILNGGFDIFRDYAYQTSVLDVDYATGAANVWANVAHPVAAIRDRGGADLVAHEVLPYRGLRPEYGQFVPNYLSHLVGEAMLYRQLGEWYRDRGVRYPDALGAATVVAMQVLNEVVENGAYRGNNTDPVADLLLFNPAGLILFSFDRVARAFAGPVQLDYWPGQAVLDLRDGYLFNSGENFALKVPLGFTRVRGFFYYSMEALFGAAVPVGGADTISVGAGFRPLTIRVEDPTSPARVLVPTGVQNLELGVFWDRNESLMTSLVVGGPTNLSVHLQVYPGVVASRWARIGGYLLASEWDGVGVGVTLAVTPIVPGFLCNRRHEMEVFR